MLQKLTIPRPWPAVYIDVPPGKRYTTVSSLQWRHNGRDSVSNHRPRDCFLNRLFRRRSKKTLQLRVRGTLCGEFTGDRGPMNSTHKWPVTRKMFRFEDVIMIVSNSIYCALAWHLSDKVINMKIVEINGRALRILYNEYSSTCGKLLAVSNSDTILLTRLKHLAL